MRKPWLVRLASGLLLCFSSVAIGGHMSQKVLSETPSQLGSKEGQALSWGFGVLGIK
jgi:hypothetical protein